jgi:2-isopropylmalate synthase
METRFADLAVLITNLDKRSIMQLDIARLIDYFGGVNALAAAWKEHYPTEVVSTAAIYKWRARASLPLAQLQKLTALAELQGRPLDLNAFIQHQPQLERTTMSSNNRVIIFDTTLRDGEQSPGAAMTKEEKIRIARQLEKLGVDVIEAGFAAASPGDFDAINTIAKTITKSTVCSLSRANERDVRAAGEAIQPAVKKRIHTFIATSPLHMEHKLKMSPQQVREAAVKAVKIACEYTDDVEFSCEDALRSDINFLVEICSDVIAAGATTINIPDTVGYAIPFQTEKFFRELIGRTQGGDKVIWSAHCHDDLGLSVSNSLAAVMGGARQVECTINGLGERAGNASLEEIVMALKTRHDVFGLETGIDTTQIVPTSKLVSTITGYPVQPNKAIVGANAFAHESGIHQDGILKCRETYEIMSAESVGWSQNRLTLGKLSGRNAFKTKLTELGIHLDTEEALNAAFARFKELADKKREIFDEDLHALVSDELVSITPDRYKYLSLKIQTETGELPQAEIVISEQGQEHRATSQGSGPVDAVFKAIESVAPSHAQLQLYSVNAITEGTESQGEVTVRLSKDGFIVNGQGADTDVIVASAKAYISALNKLQKPDERIKAQGMI